MEDNICRIPVQATYRIVDGNPVRVDTKYADIPAEVIARFLLQKFGADAIFRGGTSD